MSGALPVIDIAPLLAGDAAGSAAVALDIDAACRDAGFFYLIGNGIPDAAFADIDATARRFFAMPAADKAAIAMAGGGGAAWRGRFPLHGELTSGQPDGKDGLYLGEELGPDDPRVVAGWPLHGANLWPAQVPELRAAVTAWMAGATAAAQALATGMALALGLPRDYFARYTVQPTLLFRIFRYPPGETGFGVGEHTDYGLLTLLAQDHHGGLEVRTRRGWIDVPPRPGALVVNIGDMLDLLTGGAWQSTPHRFVDRSGAERLSWQLFFDPAFDARIEPLPGFATGADDGAQRWDGSSIHDPIGSYGDYLLRKVGHVFPDLAGRFKF